MTQRTYWHLAELGRKPGDYDIATTRLLYYLERGFETEVPLAPWYRRYQAGSPLTGVDWERFRDPRETTYARYVELQHGKEAFVDGVRAASADAGYDRRLAPAWRQQLAELIAPLRFAVHGLQMVAAYVGSMAPGGRIAVAAAFQAADEQRRVERLAYRLRELQLMGADCEGRARWQSDAMWQPLRALVERLLVTYDWGEALIALVVAVKPRFDALFTAQLAELARAAGDDAFTNVLFSLGEDQRWHRDWARALIDLALGERRAIVQAWAAQWAAPAMAAIAAFAPVFGDAMPAAVEATHAAWAASAGMVETPA